MVENTSHVYASTSSIFSSDLKKAWWFSLSILASTSRIGDKISQASSIAVNPSILMKFLTKNNCDARIENPAYKFGNNKIRLC